MGVRRERPAVERARATIRLRLPDGTVKTMSADESRAPGGEGVCCFCGRGVEEPGAGTVRLSAGWSAGGQEQTQSWSAHRACLAERMHDSVAGAGPLFGH
jgi:hypothetical protein